MERFDEKIIFLPRKNYEWENEMQAYPHVFKHKKNLYMFYNGNGYGKTGIALAKLEILLSHEFYFRASKFSKLLP